MNDSSCIFEIIYNTMQQSHNTMSIKTLCAMAGVSRSGYYAWLNAAPARAQREQQDREDFEQILTAYKMHGYSKGAKGIYMALLHMDPPVVMNLKKIRRLMDKFNLSCPYRGPNPYRRMAKALKTSSVADNLLQREFEAYGPRIVLLTDITYLPYNGTFAYLSTVLDAFTKQILSYVLSPSLEVDFVLETINKLVEYHGVSLQAETIIHSDQGCHYTSHKFINILYDKKLRQSMSRKTISSLSLLNVHHLLMFRSSLITTLIITTTGGINGILPGCRLMNSTNLLLLVNILWIFRIFLPCQP